MEFEPSFSRPLPAKDARLIEESAGRRGMELPLIAAARRQLAPRSRRSTRLAVQAVASACVRPKRR